MIDPIESLAARVKDDPFFLAPVLACYAESAGLDDDGLARDLGCPREALDRLRVCRPPRDGFFRQDVERLAGHLGLDFDKLAAAVREGQTLLRMCEAAAGAARLLAAREEPREDDP